MTVTLNSNGNYWQATWEDNQGARRRKSLGAKSKVGKRLAERMCRQLAVDLDINPALKDGHLAPALDAWCERFIGTLGDRSPATIELYETCRRYLIQHWPPDIRLDKISHGSVTDFRTMLRQRGLAEITVRKHLRHAKSIYAAALKERRVFGENPFSHLPTSPPETDDEFYYLSTKDFDRIVDVCPTPEWRCLFGVCRLAGLRRGEAFRLKWCDVDWESRTITVRNPRNVRTTKNKKRVVPIQPRLFEILSDAKPKSDNSRKMVTPQLVRNSAAHHLDRVVVDAGLEPWPSPYHAMRKSLTSDWLSEYPVMDVCRWMGHGPEVAKKFYHRTQDHTLARVTGVRAATEMTVEEIVARIVAKRDRLASADADAREIEYDAEPRLRSFGEHLLNELIDELSDSCHKFAPNSPAKASIKNK